jgi:hypothetical protein
MRAGLPPYPTGETGKPATPVNASSGVVAAGAAVATLAAGGANVMTYISGFEWTGTGQTGGPTIATVVVSGLLGGNLTYNIVSPTGVTVGIAPLIVTFDPPLQASALNTAIVVTASTLGAGSTNSTTNAHGYQLPFSS